MVSKSTHTQGFDWGSGQVYTERTCKAESTAFTWVWKTRGTSNDFIHFINDGPGCSSLQAMSIRRFLSDTFNITTSTIETLPKHLASQMWDEIKRSQVDSLRVWKIFVSVFGNQLGETLNHKRIILPGQPSDLSEYITHVVSPRFAWVTFLTLAHVPFSRTDLIQVARLTNLGKLSLGPFDGHSGLDDSIVRTWSRAASEANAFTKLRILVGRSCVNITSKIFAYLQEFPALSLLCIDVAEDAFASSAFKVQAKKNFWHPMKSNELRESIITPKSQRYSETSAWRKVYENCSKDGVFDPKGFQDYHLGADRDETTLDLVLGPGSDRYCMHTSDPQNPRLLYRSARCSNDNSSNPTRCKERMLDSNGEVELALPKKRVIRPSRRRAVDDLMQSFEQ